jgi:hypothetical protein
VFIVIYEVAATSRQRGTDTKRVLLGAIEVASADAAASAAASAAADAQAQVEAPAQAPAQAKVPTNDTG